MRAFTRMLNRNGETYATQYISKDIIKSASENGILYDARGQQR